MGSSGTIDSLRRMESESLPDVRRSRRWPALLIGGFVVQAGIRLLLAVHQKTPILIPDETGYLLAARLIAGGAAGDLSGWPLYQAGYPLLISPAFWLSDDPATVYRLVTVFNSLFGASLLVLAYVGLRRLDLSRTQAYVIATVTALLPAVIYYSQFAMADAVLPVVVLGWLLLVHAWIAGGRWGHGAAASALAAYCSCVHSRGSVIVVVHAVLLVAALWRRWAGRRDIAVAVSVLVTGSAAGWTLNGWVRSKIYPGGARPLGGLLVDRLSSLDGLAWTLSLAAGKIWFLIVSTCGVAGVGLVVVGALAVRRATPRPVRAASWVALAALTGMAIASSAAVPDEGTVANLAYGRYLGCLCPALFMAGAAFVVRGTRQTVDRAVLATTCLTLAAAGVVRWYAGNRLSHSFFSVLEFPEISFLTWSWDALRLWSATCVALFLLVLAGLVIAKYRQAGALVVAAAFIAFALADMTVVSKRVVRYWEGKLESATSLAPAGLRADDRVALDYPGLSWRIWVSQAFQVRSGLKPLDRFRRETLPSDATLVVVPWDAPLRQRPEESWPAAPRNWHPVTVRTTYAGAWAAWRPEG